MPVTLSPLAGAGQQFFDNNGNPLTGGKLYTYSAGTTTPLAAYTTNSGAIAHTNPIILDSAGRVPSGGEIWLTLGFGYKFVLTTSADVVIATYDNIPSSAQPPAANDADSIQYEQGYTVTAGSFVIGSTYRILTVGDTNFTLIGAVSNTVGIHFTATGVGTGTGTAEYSRTVETKLRETPTLEDFGAVGNGVVNDAASIQAALNSIMSTGGVIYGIPGKNYRITSGITITSSNVILDLDGATLTADFLTGNAVTVGSTTNLLNLGVRNGTIIAANSSTSLNGVVFKKNVRRQVQYGGLRILDFKGVGMQFEELNWSIQEKDAPIIERCGINLDIHDNGNALTISGASFDGATTYNVRLRGTFGITFIGGYNQFAGTAGVLLDTATIGALQSCNSTSFYGVYFEGNGTSHIIGNNGRGLIVNGCYMNADGMTGAVIDLNNWDGAFIEGNTPVSTSGRDFVNADSASTLICVGRQAVTSVSDQEIGGSVDALVTNTIPTTITTLPTPTALNQGSLFLLFGSATSANRTLPWICTTITTGTRAFRRMALQPVKQSAQAGAALLNPNINNFQTFDISIPNAGMTVNFPSGEYDDGDEITFIFRQGGSSTGTITWDLAYKTDLSNTILNNSYASVTFKWSANRLLWIQTAKFEWTV